MQQQESKRTVCKVAVMAGFEHAVEWRGCKPGVLSDNTFTVLSERHRNQSQLVSGYHRLHRDTHTLRMHRQAEAEACNGPPGDTGVSWFDFMQSCLLFQRLEHHSAAVNRNPVLGSCEQPPVSSGRSGSIASVFFWPECCLFFRHWPIFSVLMD